MVVRYSPCQVRSSHVKSDQFTAFITSRRVCTRQVRKTRLIPPPQGRKREAFFIKRSLPYICLLLFVVYIAFLFKPSKTASGPINGRSNLSNLMAVFLPMLTLSVGLTGIPSHHSDPSSISS